MKYCQHHMSYSKVGLVSVWNSVAVFQFKTRFVQLQKYTNFHRNVTLA